MPGAALFLGVASFGLDVNKVAQVAKDVMDSVSPWAGWLHCFRKNAKSNLLIHPVMDLREGAEFDNPVADDDNVTST